MSYYLERGRLLLAQNRYREAEKELRQAIAEDPESPIAPALLAECLIENNRYAEALEMAQRSVRLEPGLPFLYYILARAYFFNKQTGKAREVIRQGQHLNPFEANFFLLLAHIEYYGENWQKSLQASEQGLELEPESVQLINMRARALVKLNRQDEAASTLDYALHKAPEDAFSHANKGWVAIERDQYDEAITHFREALRLDPVSYYARSGLKEAIKGQNFLYRYILKYFLWMGKMTERSRWGFIIGAYIIYRILIGIAESSPAAAPFLYPLIIAYIIFAFSSWIALPVSNLFLRLHPLGKYALDEDEILGSNIVGLLGAGATISLIAFYFTEVVSLLHLGGFLALMLLPVGGLFGVSADGRARRLLTIYTLSLAGVGLLALLIPGMNWAVFAFFIGIFGYGWFANYWIGRDAKEF